MAVSGVESSPSAGPIGLLDTQFTRVYTHLHPILVHLWFYLQFGSLVADPESTLLSIIVPLAISQFLYCVICLPPIGSLGEVKSTKAGSQKKSGNLPKVVQTSVKLSTRISTALLSQLLALLAGTPLFTVTLILFGAPATTHLGHTILSGAHLAILSTAPLVYVHGVSGAIWRKIGALMLPIDEVLGAAVGTMFGAWLGAIPIPLDWDREWQKWPVTIVTGAYIGWAGGKVAGRYLFFGKVLNLTGR